MTIHKVKPIMGEPFDVNQIEEEVAEVVQEAHDRVGARAVRLRLPRGEEHSSDSERVEQRPQDDQQVGQEDPINPSHYRRSPSGVECIEVTEHMNFCVGNAMKYIWRYMDKGDPVENLKKAQWYLDREIARLVRMGQ